MTRLSVEYRFDLSTQFVLDSPRGAVSIDRLKTIEFLHGFELFLNLTLVFYETGVHIGGPVHIHSGFPIIQRGVFAQIPFNENARADGQVEHRVRNKCDAVDLPDPGRFNSTDDRPRHQRIDITVCQDDETRAESREDAVLELVGKIRRIKQAQCSCAENVALHRLFELAAHQHRSLQADVYRGIAQTFKPISQQVDLRRSSRPVGAFDNNELSL